MSCWVIIGYVMCVIKCFIKQGIKFLKINMNKYLNDIIEKGLIGLFVSLWELFVVLVFQNVQRMCYLVVDKINLQLKMIFIDLKVEMGDCQK